MMKNSIRPKKQVWWRRLLRACMAVIAVCLVAVSVILLFVQTESGRKLLADTLSESFTGEGITVKVTGIKRGLPALVAFDGLSIADVDGEWLKLDSVRLEWAWSKLLIGKIKINSLSVESIDIVRKPSFPEKNAAEGSSSSSVLQKVKFELKTLLLKEICLGSDLTNQSSRFSVKSDSALLKMPRKLMVRLELGGGVYGKVDLRCDNRSVNGELEVTVVDLAPIGSVMGFVTEGAWRCESKFSNSDGRQALRIESDINMNLGDVGAVSNLAVHVDLDDLYGVPSGKAEVICRYLNWNELALDEFMLGVQSRDGVLALAADAAGSWQVPFAVSTTGSVTFAESRLALAIENIAVTVADIDTGSASATLSMPMPWLQGKSKKSDDAGVKMAIKIDATIDVFGNLPVLANSSVKGGLMVDLSYHKRTSGVILEGKCSLKDAYYENYIIGTIIDKINVTAMAEDNGINISDGSATDGKSGRLELRGSLDLSSIKERLLELSIDMNKCVVLRKDDLQAMASGSVQLKGVGGDVAATGLLNIDEGRMDLNSMAPALPLVLVDSGSEKVVTEKVDKGSQKKRWSSDIKIKTVGPFYIVGKGLNSVWGADLHFVNGKGGMGLKGEVESRSGSFLFLSRKFVFDRGQISFDGRWPSVPTLNIVMIHERADIKARMIISGKADNPKISMDSIPAMPEDEVFAHILFGKNLSQISAFQAVQVATSMQGMRDGTNIDFMQRTKQSFGLDKVGFGTIDDGDDSGGETTTLAVGKYLTEGLYTEINAPIGVGSDARVTVEYEVRPNLTIETEAGMNMRPGMGVNWKIDY